MSRQMSLEGLAFRQEIEQRGYAEIAHSIPTDHIETLVSAYMDFTLAHPDPELATMDAMLPATTANFDPEKDKISLDDLDRSLDDDLMWHKYRTNVPGVGKPDGYTNRSFQAGSLLVNRGLDLGEDPKEYYHFTPVHLANMAAAHEKYDWGIMPPEVYKLAEAFEPIHGAATQLMMKICGLIEDTHPEIRDFVTLDSLRTSPLRFLNYHPTGDHTLAGKHYDKGIWTIQIAESHEGLRVATNRDASLTRVVRKPELAVTFPAWDVHAQIDHQTPFQPGWHDVVNLDTLNEGRFVPEHAKKVCARWALILFGHTVEFVNPEKHLMHTR